LLTPLLQILSALQAAKNPSLSLLSPLRLEDGPPLPLDQQLRGDPELPSLFTIRGVCQYLMYLCTGAIGVENKVYHGCYSTF
jgi:hypothetical protein